MTTHAEMVEGVRDLVAEMTAAMEALQKRYPISTFMAAMQARKCLDNEQYGEAADLARVVLAVVRGVPEGAVEVESFGVTVLLALVQDHIASSKAAEHGDADRMRTRMRTQLMGLERKLAGAEAVYIVSRDKVDS